MYKKKEYEKYENQCHNCQTNENIERDTIEYGFVSILSCVCLESWWPFLPSRSKRTFIIKLITTIFTMLSMLTILIARKVSHWRGCSLHRICLPLNKWKKGASIKGFKVIFIHQTWFKLFSCCEGSVRLRNENKNYGYICQLSKYFRDVNWTVCGRVSYHYKWALINFSQYVSSHKGMCFIISDGCCFYSLFGRLRCFWLFIQYILWFNQSHKTEKTSMN